MHIYSKSSPNLINSVAHEITTESTNTSVFESSTYNETITFMYEESEEKKRILDFFKIVRIIVPIIFALIVVTGIAGNTVTVTVLLLNKDSRTIADILIINLAVADIFFIVFCIPFIAVDFAMLDAFGNSQWPFGDKWCRVVEYVTYACSYTIL
ncbi:hypothetical protein CHS0354_029338 [Potamilus streckersoni]|uniref:G-protein coupled receptors family 1 profile domain-containing protein n=1 Tax=Potamilus streckersoni TaxID=2493646 RepID=A0AAE0W6Z0_9BIVA|nr:hypothetical protein CHS0354_029338 [Potamilus streckersoni]